MELLSCPVSTLITFLAGSGLTVNVLDGKDKKTPITDYRWIIEEDRTFYIDPNCTTNPPPTGCKTTTNTSGTNSFRLSAPTSTPATCRSWRLAAPGRCLAKTDRRFGGVNAVCDIGNGVCRPSVCRNPLAIPAKSHLDPTKRYYISVLPGDAANPFNTANVGEGPRNGWRSDLVRVPADTPTGTVPTCAAILHGHLSPF